MYFDARAAKSLQPGGHIVVQGCPGLRLEAGATRKTWTYRYRSPVDDKLKQVKIGAWPAMSVASAAASWQELRDRRDSGTDLALEKKLDKLAVKSAPDTGYTIRSLIADYADGYLDKRREPKGAKAVRARLNNALAAHASLPAAAVTRRLVFDLIEKLSGSPVAAKSVRTEMAAAWRYAMDAGRLPETAPNWWAEVKARQLRSKGALRAGVRKGTTKRVLSAQEIKTLITKELGLFSQQVQDFLTLQLWTCTRGGEVCLMRVEHLAESDGVLWWTMPKELTKNVHRENATDLRVPLVGRAERTVRRLLPAAAGGWLFPSVSHAGEVVGQTQAYMQSKVHYRQPYSKTKPHHVRDRLTVTHWSPHDLRRTGRTLLASMGCPHEIGEAILGHVLPGVAGDYNLYRYDKERLQWLQALDAQLEEIIGAA